MIPPDAPCQGRYDDLQHAKLAAGAFTRGGGGTWLYRVRWHPVARWAAYPWGVFAFPFWRRWEADAISPVGEVIHADLMHHLWRCPEPGCGATWQLGLMCPACLGTIPRAQWPPLEPQAPEPPFPTVVELAVA